MKSVFFGLLLSTAGLLSGCATAGSTISQVNEQSRQLQFELDREREITKEREDEQRRLDWQITSLKAKEKRLSSTSNQDMNQLTQIREAISKLEKRRSSLGDFAVASESQSSH